MLNTDTDSSQTHPDFSFEGPRNEVDSELVEAIVVETDEVIKLLEDKKFKEARKSRRFIILFITLSLGITFNYLYLINIKTFG